jgi:hypothetical protein
MVDQTIAKSLGLIKDLTILVHGIPYLVSFIMIQNNVLDSSYSMLLGCPWPKDAKVSHDWGNILSLYKEWVQLELYLLQRNLQHQLSI